MAEQLYKVEDPSGNIREIVGPAGASDEEVIAQAKQLFATTEGGAVTGRAGISRSTGVQTEVPAAADIAGAGALGAVGGIVAPSILGAAGAALSSVPFPGARILGRGLTYMGEAAANIKPVVRAAEGFTGGIASETAGKIGRAHV